jgi:hypothetical protein
VLPHNFPGICCDPLKLAACGSSGEEDGDDAFAEVNFVNMVAEGGDPRSLSVGSDTPDKVKEDFADMLVTSLGDAAGCILGPKMHIELDESRNIKPLQITTAR